MTSRHSLLVQLIDYSAPIVATIEALRPFGWDSDKPIAVLRRSDVAAVLERYAQSALSVVNVEQWANAIESREDVAYEAGYEEVISFAVNQLANPLLTKPLTIETAQELLSMLTIDG